MREDSLQRKAGYVEIWMLRTIWDFFAQRSLILISHSHNLFSWDVEWLHSWGCWIYNKRATFTQVSISFSHRRERISITSKYDVNNEEHWHFRSEISIKRTSIVCLFYFPFLWWCYSTQAGNITQAYLWICVISTRYSYSSFCEWLFYIPISLSQLPLSMQSFTA